MIGLLSLGCIWAQRPHYRYSERVKSLQIAYISQEMQLLPEEAQTFWPIYNAREQELQKSRGALRERIRSLIERKGSLSPEAYRDSIGAIYLSLWQREAEIRQRYHEQFKKALPPEKVARFYLAEMRLLRRALGEERPAMMDE